MGAISCVWRYQPHDALLIYQPHNTETRLGPMSKKNGGVEQKNNAKREKKMNPPKKAQPKQMR